jgi:hypothetical protein
MRPTAKLIHKTDMTYLPTAFPAHYYGMPDGRIYLIFSRFYRVNYGEKGNGIEFVFAEHKEFFYDYQNDKIYRQNSLNQNPVWEENVDKLNPEIEIIKVDKNLNSYGEAYAVLNSEALHMAEPVYELQAS